MKLPRIDELDLKGKKVLVRADLDISEVDKENFRLECLLPTLKYLSEQNCSIIVIGHRGRPSEIPDGKTKEQVQEELSLKSVSEALEALLKKRWGEEKVKNLNMQMMENLRFNLGEEENDVSFTKHLAESGEVYINEAFAISHREHASIVGLPKFMPHAAGFRFLEEVENLSKVFENPVRPVVAIISGIKKDKMDYIEPFKEFTDKILIAGRLPEFMPEDNADPKLLIAKLLPDKEDITIHSIENFIDEIKKAKTIIVSGPIGKYEEEGHRMGTERVFYAVANSSAFKVAGGGDTISALNLLGLRDKFDWLSVGGGAMLEFLTKKTLPGIDVLT
jgi:phosphoglycerate kinase